MGLFRQKQETAAERRRAAFAEMALRHEADMLRTARRLTMGSEDRAQDLVQDALVRAYAAYLDGQFHEGGSARAWLLRIVTNLFINDYRRRVKWEAGVDVDTLTAGGEVGPPGTHAAPGEVPDRALERRTLDEPLEKALAALAEPLRVAVLLVDVEEYSYEEAARLLDVPIGTIRSRLARARYQLQDRLREYAREHRLGGGETTATTRRGEVGA
jgi:RNA polymerase sigma-70 factor (ECF subfamily)